MDIPNPTPITQAATAEKVFDKQFCTKLEILASPNKPWSARFIGFPYDGVDILTQNGVSVELRDLKSLSAIDHELAMAMGGVLAVIGKYLVKCRVKGKYVVTTENIAEILEE